AHRLFAPDALVGERFRIVREVARGGMAIVYEAIDEKLGERIAIKRPRPGYGRRLPPEVRSALKVTHPNVCRAYGIHSVRDEDFDFLTMEFLESEPLADRIHREGPFGTVAARTLALQLCAGLEEAHRKGVIHGDLKSRNVVLVDNLTGDPRAVITDFGLARVLPAGIAIEAPGVTGATGLCGTPGYMAPELWRGEPASAASDIYALGVILHEMIVGHRPL